MSQQSGAWGTSRWNDDSWGVATSSVNVTAGFDIPRLILRYNSAESRVEDSLDRAVVTLNGVDITDAVFSFRVSLSANGSANLARVQMVSEIPVVAGGSELQIVYDSVVLFAGKAQDVPTEAGRIDRDIVAVSPDEILSQTPCPEMSSKLYCSALLRAAAGAGGFTVELGDFQDYFMGIIRTETRQVKFIYRGPGPSEEGSLWHENDWGGGSSFIPRHTPNNTTVYKETIRTITTEVWESHRFSTLRQAIDAFANSMHSSHVFHVPGTTTLRVSNWHKIRRNLGTVAQGAMFACNSVETTQGRINHIDLTCRDGKTVTIKNTPDIDAHGLHRTEMTTQLGNSNSEWALCSAYSAMAKSQAQVVQWETVLNPHLMPTDGVAVWTPNGEKRVKIESVEHTLEMGAGGATSVWTGRVMP